MQIGVGIGGCDSVPQAGVKLSLNTEVPLRRQVPTDTGGIATETCPKKHRHENGWRLGRPVINRAAREQVRAPMHYGYAALQRPRQVYLLTVGWNRNLICTF